MQAAFHRRVAGEFLLDPGVAATAVVRRQLDRDGSAGLGRGADSLVFGWTMVLVYPFGIYVPYRVQSEQT